MAWKRLLALALITGSVDEQFILQNEYLVTENRILRRQLRGRLKLTDSQCVSLAKIGKRLGRKALQEVAQILRPETILSWHRRLVAKEFDGSKKRAHVEPSPKAEALEGLVLQLARDNGRWGYRRIAGALSNPAPSSSVHRNQATSLALRH
jgi:putative transposase